MRPRPATSNGFLSEMDRSSRQSFIRTGSDSFAVDTLRLDEGNDNNAGFSNHGAPGRRSAHEDDSVQFYRHNENIPGYTGHVPRLQQTHGTGYTAASRLALMAPPAPDKKNRPQSSYDQKRARRVVTASHWLAGSTFSGYASPTGEKGKGGADASENGAHKYLQGSDVDLQAYYTTLASQNYKQLLIKSGAPEKARSSIHNGDNFYFCGPHMWQTAYNESFSKMNTVPKENLRATDSKKSTGLESMILAQGNTIDEGVSSGKVSAKDRAYRYKMLQAIVGGKRLDSIDKIMRNKLKQMTNSNKHEATNMFKILDKDGDGCLTSEKFFQMARVLGIHATATEAAALFGRYDENFDGEMSFHEFLDHFDKVDTH